MAKETNSDDLVVNAAKGSKNTENKNDKDNAPEPSTAAKQQAPETNVPPETNKPPEPPASKTSTPEADATTPGPILSVSPQITKVRMVKVRGLKNEKSNIAGNTYNIEAKEEKEVPADVCAIWQNAGVAIKL